MCTASDPDTGIPERRQYGACNASAIFYIWLAQDVVGGGIASIFWGADRGIDWVVDRTGRATKWGAGVAKSFDDNYIDGTVRKLSNGTFAVGRWLRKQQSGVLQDYNQQLVLGIIALMIIILGLFYIIPYYQVVKKDV